MLVNTFAMSNFNYCSLVWNFSSAQSLNKIKNLQKRALRFLLNNYDSTYEDSLEKSGYPNVNFKRQKTLCIEIYKIFYKLIQDSRKMQTKPGNSKTQSYHFWYKKPKELRSENMKCPTLPYKNFR